MLTQLILNLGQHLRRQGVSTAGKPQGKPIICSPFPNSSSCWPSFSAVSTDWGDPGRCPGKAGLLPSPHHQWLHYAIDVTARAQTGKLQVPADSKNWTHTVEILSHQLLKPTKFASDARCRLYGKTVWFLIKTDGKFHPTVSLLTYWYIFN